MGEERRALRELGMHIIYIKSRDNREAQDTQRPSKVSVYSATKNILKQDSCPLGSSSWSYYEIYQAEVGKVFLLSVPVFILMFWTT